MVRVIDLDVNGNVSRCTGATQPTDGDSGYSVGCIFSVTTGVTGATTYINEGSTSSANFNAVGGGAGGSATMNQVYEGGRLVSVDSGTIVYTDATTGSLDTLRITTSGTKTGDAIEFLMTGASTGRVLQLDMDAAIAAVGIHIDSGGGARTGDDLRFTDDSTGTHSIFNINKSGSGASTAIDYQESFNGSSASFVVQATLDNTDGLDTTVLQAVRGTGVRTVPVIDINDASTGSANVIDVRLTGVYTGNMFDFASTAASTGNVIFMNMDNAVAMTGIHIEGSGVRTQPFIEFNTDATGSANMFQADVSGAISGNVMDFNMSTTGSGNVIDITYSAANTGDAVSVVMANNVAGAALLVTGAGARSDNLIDVVSAETGSVDGMVLFETSGVFTGHMLNVHAGGAATTAGLVHLNLDAGVAYKAITIDHAGARTVETILVTFDGTYGSGLGGTFLNADISMTGAAASDFFDINVTGVYTGNIFDVLYGAAAVTGDIASFDLGATAVAATVLRLASGNMIRTSEMIVITDAGASTGAIFDINRTAAAEGEIFDINETAVTTGNVFDYATSSASTGTIFEVTLANAVGAILENYTLSGTRTADAMVITHSGAGAVDIHAIVDSGTSSGHVWDVNMTGNSTGNVLDIVASTSKVAGHLIHLDLGTDLAGNALLIDAAGIRTEPIIFINNAATDGGTNDHVIDINQTGLLDSNVLDITYSSGVSTGNAVSLAMGTNVAGMAITVSSAGTGVSGEGSTFNVAHTGALVAGADCVRISSTGSPSSTSHTLAVEQSSGAGTSGAYALYVNATGTNVEGLYVDAGTSQFDEALTCDGLVTFSSLSDGTTTMTSTTLELNRAADVSTRLVAAGGTLTLTLASHDGRYIQLDTAAGSVVTLPAATGTGAIFYFYVSAIATSNSHIIKVVGTDVMDGMIFSLSDNSANVVGWIAGATDDTITLNRTTTGSVTNGEFIRLIDSASGVWSVSGMTASTGTEATPFSSAV